MLDYDGRVVLHCPAPWLDCNCANYRYELDFFSLILTRLGGSAVFLSALGGGFVHNLLQRARASIGPSEGTLVHASPFVCQEIMSVIVWHMSQIQQ